MSRISDEELRRLLTAKTPGPWTMEVEAGPEFDFPEFYVCSPETVCDATVVATMGGALKIPEARKIADAHLIAHAPQLAAEVLQLRATLRAITATDCYSRDECTAMAEAALSPAPVVDAVKQGDA